MSQQLIFKISCLYDYVYISVTENPVKSCSESSYETFKAS
jgi:hypothetical protein